jgi:hypothetical protein
VTGVVLVLSFFILFFCCSISRMSSCNGEKILFSRCLLFYGDICINIHRLVYTCKKVHFWTYILTQHKDEAISKLKNLVVKVILFKARRVELVRHYHSDQAGELQEGSETPKPCITWNGL